MRTAIVLPTYNEAANLGRLARAVRAACADVEIVVVDDASPDGTGAIADSLARELSGFHVVHRTDERGLGTAYLAGFRHALRQGVGAVMTMDCDFSHDPAAVPSLLTAAAEADLVIGSRYTAGGRVVNWPVHRRALSATANRFVKTLFTLPAADCTSGFRLYRREVLESVKWEKIRSSGYAFLVETLFWATRDGAVRVREVPICFTDRIDGESKLGLKEAANGARNLIRLKRDLMVSGKHRGG